MFSKDFSYKLESLMKGHQPKELVLKPTVKTKKSPDFTEVFKGAPIGNCNAKGGGTGCGSGGGSPEAKLDRHEVGLLQDSHGTWGGEHEERGIRVDEGARGSGASKLRAFNSLLDKGLIARDKPPSSQHNLVSGTDAVGRRAGNTTLTVHTAVVTEAGKKLRSTLE